MIPAGDGGRRVWCGAGDLAAVAGETAELLVAGRTDSLFYHCPVLKRMLFTFTAWVDSHNTHYDCREHRSLRRSCVISDFRCEVDENCVLQGYYP